MMGIVHKLLVLLVFFHVSIFAQQFKPHIGLNDRLMNSFLLCDSSDTESLIAKYDEVDIARYNEEYNKFFACSKKADEVALNLVLHSKLECAKAAQILLKHELVCQISLDAIKIATDISTRNKLALEIKGCLQMVTTICEDFLTEKNIPRPE